MDKGLLDTLSRTQKIALVLISISKEPVKGETWYQKEMFLISKRDKAMSDEVLFEPHHYGPHSYDVASALEDLESEGLVGETGDGQITLTEEGEKLVRLLEQDFDPGELDFFRYVKALLNDLTKMELLAFIYQTNKNMTTQSVELQRVKEGLVEYAVSLFRKKKLSVAKAAEISGLPLSNFISELKKRNIKIETGL